MTRPNNGITHKKSGALRRKVRKFSYLTFSQGELKRCNARRKLQIPAIFDESFIGIDGCTAPSVPTNCAWEPGVGGHCRHVDQLKYKGKFKGPVLMIVFSIVFGLAAVSTFVS